MPNHLFRRGLAALLMSGISLHAALAMNGATPLIIDGGPLGQFDLSGATDGFFFAQTGTADKENADNSILGSDATGARLGGMQFHLKKSTGIVQFNVIAGVFGGAPVLGTAPPRANTHTFPTSPVKLAYVTLALPGSPVTISAGQVPSLEGYEDAVDYNNANIFASTAWYVENGASRGISASYTKGPAALTVTYGDGWETGVFNVIQTIGSYNFDANNSLSLFYTGNLSRTGNYTRTYGGYKLVSYGTNYVNSQLFGAFYSWTSGNLNLVPEVQYVYAKPDQDVGIKKYTANFTAVAVGDYNFGASPYSLGGLVEYFDSVGTTHNSQNYWFIAPGAAGVGVELTPTWQHGDIFARASAGYLYLTDQGSPAAGYGNAGKTRDMVQVALEGGVMF